MQRLAYSVLLIILISSCKDVTLWAIEEQTAMLVNNKNSETFSCNSEKVRELVCLSFDDLAKIKRRCGN